MLNNNGRRQRRTFKEEFKRDAVDLVVKKGYSFQSAADAVDVHVNSIRLWYEKYGPEGDMFPTNTKEIELMTELKHLRDRLVEVEQEREILKKAMAYFIRDSQI